LGVKAGFDYQSNNFSTDLANFELPPGAGWFAGVQGDLSWGGFGVHPEVLFSHNAFNVETFNSKIKLNKIDIPLLLQYRLFGILALQAGPTFCVMTSTDGEIGGIKWDINRPTVGYAAGFEVKVWKLAVSARYNGAFKRSEVLGYSTGKNKIDTIQIGVGYYF
jgi:nitric oxide synthase oxygenase domain/subunit